MDIKDFLLNCITLGYSTWNKFQESLVECEQLRADLQFARNELKTCRRKSHQLKDLASRKIKSLQTLLANQKNSYIELERVSKEEINGLQQYADSLEVKLKRWQCVEDAQAEAKKIQDQSNQEAKETRSSALKILSNARVRAEQIEVSAKVSVQLAERDTAKFRAEKGKYERRITAIKNEIKGYGDEYIIPAHTLLDELAEDIGYSEAGKQLKLARLPSKRTRQERRGLKMFLRR